MNDESQPRRRTGVVRTPNGVFRPSDDSGVMITVTQPHDPAYFLLKDGHASSTTVYHRGCYICEDPEFAQMGLPLCRECPECRKAGRLAPEPNRGYGHVAADGGECSECGHDEYEAYYAELEAKQREGRTDDPAP